MSDDQPTGPESIPPPPGAVPPTASPVPPPPPPPAAAPPMPPPPPPLPAYQPAPATTTTVKRGFAGRVGAGVVGLAVLGGGLAYAVSQAGGAGGASSPEAAAQALFDAVAAEDVIGVLDLLPDGERRAVQDPIESMADELVRLGVVGDDLDLSAVGGLDLEFEDLQFETEQLAEGIAVVRLTGGTAVVSVEPGELPIGDDLNALIEDVTGEPIEIDPIDDVRTTIEPGEGDFEVVAVEEDGTWRISLFYSVAEAARQGAGLEAPDFGAGVEAVGAESPEAAVEALVRAAAEEQDLEAVIALLPPDEMAALQDYAPLFLDDAQREIDEASDDLEVVVSDLQLDATEDGDTASVAVSGFSVDASMDGEDVSLTFDGECVTFEGPEGEVEEQCAGDLEDLGVLGEVLRFEDGQVAGVRTVQVGGRWYVSPTRTLLDSVVVVLGGLDDDVLSSWPDLLDDGFGFSEEMFEDSGLGEIEELDDVGEALDRPDGSDEVEVGSPTTTALLEPPSIEGLTAMLLGEQGFTADEASCIASAVYGAGYPDELLSTLQTGELPDEVYDEVNGFVTTCLGG
jgi:hypothetical protein